MRTVFARENDRRRALRKKATTALRVNAPAPVLDNTVMARESAIRALDAPSAMLDQIIHAGESRTEDILATLKFTSSRMAEEFAALSPVISTARGSGSNFSTNPDEWVGTIKVRGANGEELDIEDDETDDEDLLGDDPPTLPQCLINKYSTKTVSSSRAVVAAAAEDDATGPVVCAPEFTTTESDFSRFDMDLVRMHYVEYLLEPILRDKLLDKHYKVLLIL